MLRRKRATAPSMTGDIASQRRAAVTSILCLIPDADPLFLDSALHAYPSRPPAEAASHIVDKLLEMKGTHPSVARQPSRKGKERASDPDEALDTINRDLCAPFLL